MRQLLWVSFLAMISAGSALAATQTVSFQNGINGYTGTFDRKIDDRATATPTTEVDGSTVPHYFVDGYQADPVSADGQALIRFGNIIGSGAGQIPANAFILDAQLQVSTSPAGNAQSAGPWGVARLLQAFDSTTSYFTSFPCDGCTIGSRGAWWQDNYSTRPMAGFGGQWQGAIDSTFIGPLVQAWASGQENHGLVVQTGFGSDALQTSGTVDGWAINATGHPLAGLRPKLSVTYTTDPIEQNTFQRDLNGYTGDTMAWVRSGTALFGTEMTPDPSVDDVTTDGLTLTQSFLDGPQFSNPQGDTSSPDDLALVKFGNVFGAGANQAPSDVPVAKAWLVVTTGEASQNAPTNGDWSVHPVLRNWDTTTTYTSFGSTPGLQIEDGDLGAALQTKEGIITGSEVWFDVTSYLEGVRNGAVDNGLAVLSTATADGWQIHFNGSTEASARPRLVVASGNPTIVVPGLTGDYNANGTVDAADYVIWRNNLDQSVTLPNDSTPGTVTQADYDEWRNNFGEVADIGGPLGSAAAVPEPGTWLLVLAAVAMSSFGTRRRS
jgi:hypothetical protein